MNESTEHANFSSLNRLSSKLDPNQFNLMFNLFFLIATFANRELKIYLLYFSDSEFS